MLPVAEHGQPRKSVLHGARFRAHPGQPAFFIASRGTSSSSGFGVAAVRPIKDSFRDADQGWFQARMASLTLTPRSPCLPRRFPSRQRDVFVRETLVDSPDQVAPDLEPIIIGLGPGP